MSCSAREGLVYTKFVSPWVNVRLEYNVINQVISYWPSYRSEDGYIGPKPMANTKLINDNVINQLLKDRA